jgi:hypothetical protein
VALALSRLPLESFACRRASTDVTGDEQIGIFDFGQSANRFELKNAPAEKALPISREDELLLRRRVQTWVFSDRFLLFVIGPRYRWYLGLGVRGRHCVQSATPGDKLEGGLTNLGQVNLLVSVSVCGLDRRILGRQQRSSSPIMFFGRTAECSGLQFTGKNQPSVLQFSPAKPKPLGFNAGTAKSWTTPTLRMSPLANDKTGSPGAASRMLS